MIVLLPTSPMKNSIVVYFGTITVPADDVHLTPFCQTPLPKEERARLRYLKGCEPKDGRKRNHPFYHKHDE
jgi:hypothetical protein